jgi:hypothetical protein
MRQRIFNFVLERDWIELRGLSSAWKSDLDSLFGANVDLTHEKIIKFQKKFAGKPWVLPIAHYNLINLKDDIKSNYFRSLPQPASISIVKQISSKNFNRLTNIWPSIEGISFGIYSLCFEKLEKQPLNNFPVLKRLSIVLDTLELKPLHNVGTKLNKIRSNLSRILEIPFPNLRVISYEVLNFKNESMCFHIAPILLLIAKCFKTVRDIKLSFDSGKGSDYDRLQLNQVHKPYPDYVTQAELTPDQRDALQNLDELKLEKCELHVPSVEGCPRESSVCNWLKRILDSQSRMSQLTVETQIGACVICFHGLISRNHDSLTQLDINLPLSHLTPFDFGTFSGCGRLKSLRLKRTFVPDNAFNTRSPVPVGLKTLPLSLKKMALVHFEFTFRQLNVIVKRLVNLEALILDRWSYPDHITCCTNSTSLFVHTLMEILGSGPWKLKFVSICFQHENLTQVILGHLQRSELHAFFPNKIWKFDKVYRKIAYVPPCQIVFYKDNLDCKKQWFSPFMYQKVRL